MNIVIKNNSIIIKGDFDKDPKLTSTGKSHLVAGTGGWIVAVDEKGVQYKVLVNVIRPLPKN